MFRSDDGKSKKAAAATGKENLDAFEFGDADVEEMLNSAEDIMMEGKGILEGFLPSEGDGDGEQGMSDNLATLVQRHVKR